MYGLVAIDGSHAAVDGHLLGRQHVDVGVLGKRRPVDSAHLREGIKPAMYGLVAIDGSHAAVDGHLLGRQHVDVGVLGKRRLREAVH